MKRVLFVICLFMLLVFSNSKTTLALYVYQPAVGSANFSELKGLSTELLRIDVAFFELLREREEETTEISYSDIQATIVDPLSKLAQQYHQFGDSHSVQEITSTSRMQAAVSTINQVAGGNQNFANTTQIAEFFASQLENVVKQAGEFKGLGPSNTLDVEQRQALERIVSNVARLFIIGSQLSIVLQDQP